MALIEAFGFRLERIAGDHHIFIHPATQAMLNVQPRQGKAKAYQVEQLLETADRLNLTLED